MKLKKVATTDEDVVTYTFQYWAKADAQLLVRPDSEHLLFYPATRRVTVSAGVCPEPLQAFETREVTARWLRS